MDRLMRFPEADVHDETIDEWLHRHDDELHAIAQKWFARMRESGPNVRELMHDGCPVACVEDAAFGYVNIFKAHVNVGFFTGASLRDPAGLLEGTGKYMRHVKLKPGAEVDESALSQLIRTAYLNVKTRVQSE